MELEDNNPTDPYAIAVKTEMNNIPFTVGHLPREISRVINKFISHGGTIQVKLASVRRRRSKICQGGLEVPISVTAKHDKAQFIER